MPYRFLLTLVTFLELAAASAAGATTVSLLPTARGAYRGDLGVFGTGQSGTPTGNFLTGLNDGVEYRGFLVFDLTGVTDTIQGAAFRVNLSSLACCSVNVGAPALFEELSLFDVSSDLVALTGNAGGIPAFDDLGSGTLLGRFLYETSMRGMVIDIPLNAAGVAALNTASGLIGIGLAVTSLSGADQEYIFGSSAVNPAGFSLLELNLQVPEPLAGTLLTLAAGFSFTPRAPRAAAMLAWARQASARPSLPNR